MTTLLALVTASLTFLFIALMVEGSDTGAALVSYAALASFVLIAWHGERADRRRALRRVKYKNPPHTREDRGQWTRHS